MKKCLNELPKDEVSRIVRNHLIQKLPHNFEIEDGIPEGCMLYGVSSDMPCWYVRIPPEQLRTGPSRFICICKKSGKVVYDGLVEG
jgi:hypothetical protein